MGNHQINIQHLGKEVMTLDDILPEEPGLKLLFVAKVPAPDSVAAGHYFQGRQGKMFWNKLKDYGVLNVPRGEKEDDYLLSHNYGMIDIVKVPRKFGNEPQSDEYEEGISRLFNILEIHKPKIIVFVYKKVFDKILNHRFKISLKSDYGFNEIYEDRFGCKLFVFPMPGTPCKGNDADVYMKKLADTLFRLT
jgi:G:T/U-mismatch repair DNA glycosylase